MNNLFFIIVFISHAFSQSWHNHPELEWKTIETEHFLVHYHLETKRSAEEAAIVAEKIYDPITSFYDFEPDSKTHLIIKDVDDKSNGMAYYYDNKIVIWALPLDYDLRGAHRWLNNVITHEFTHIVQIGVAMKYPRRFPTSFIQFLNYEDEKREDVLYGYPNVLMSYPIPGVSVPPWLAEGTAQFMYPNADFDFWDSHRDMIVRDRILNENLLSFEAMNSFGKRGIGNESIYNQGFLFCKWLVDNYGLDVLKKISNELSNPFNYSINISMKNSTGILGNELYEKWKSELEMDYHKRTQTILENEEKGEVIISDGTTNIHPVWSPDEKRFAYLSNKDNDGFGQTDLFYYDFSDSLSKKIASGAYSAPSWINDSTIIYSKRSKPNKFGSSFFDLYVYFIEKEEEKRMTFDSRLTSPAFNSKTNTIAAIKSYDGTSNIMISSDVNFDNEELPFTSLTNLDNGMHLFSLAWIDDVLYVDGVYHQGREIYKVNEVSGQLVLVEKTYWDNRDPSDMLDGIVYVTDETGIMNLVFSKQGVDEYITNVLGGAFMPNVSKSGKVLFSLFENGRYNISMIRQKRIIPSELVGYELNYFNDQDLSELILGKPLSAVNYEEKMLSMSIIPKLMVDYNTIKPGLYFYSSEVIDRFSIFGGISANELWDMDVFLMMEYMKYKPTYYANLFWISRHREAKKPFLYPRIDGTTVDNIHIYNDLKFNLFSVDIGSRFAIGIHKYKVQYNFSNYRQHIYQNVYQYWDYDSLNTIHRYGEFGFDYYRAQSLSLIYDLDKRKRSHAMNMLPNNGYEIHGIISHEWNQFMDGFTVSEEHSTFGANFRPHNTFRFIFDIDKHFTLNKENKIVATMAMSGGGVSNSKIDNFFHFFGGGMPGMKGYTFYDSTLTGPYYLIGSSTIRLPIFMEENFILAQFNLQNMSLGGTFQIGAAMDEGFKDFMENHKLSYGLEFRINGFSFYSYPTAIGYEFHQPIDDIDNKGKHYFTLLFDY
ncbi:MAG: hypothetical protein VX820_05345 [Candidatus Neomarinimicrobiota bacterium]|nr:hypothetical protein [Candidatus Neomarinimicrobiota bacterium]